MKNQSFSKLLRILAAVLVMAVGYQLLPGPDDLRQGARNQLAADFLRDFHEADEADGKNRLPEAPLLLPGGGELKTAMLTDGKYTLVNFWASWCAPCIEELPSLSLLQEKRSGINVVAVSLDMQKDIQSLAQQFSGPLTGLNWAYDHTGALRKALRLEVYPSTYLLDPDGYILYRLQGPADWSSAKALNFIDSVTQ